jgi:hypothetical protein
MRTVKIYGGTGLGYATKITDAKTGAEIPGVQSFTISCGGCDEIVTADLKIILVETEINARARFFAEYADETGRKRLREVAKIIWADASSTDFD